MVQFSKKDKLHNFTKLFTFKDKSPGAVYNN